MWNKLLLHTQISIAGSKSVVTARLKRTNPGLKVSPAWKIRVDGLFLIYISPMCFDSRHELTTRCRRFGRRLGRRFGRRFGRSSPGLLCSSGLRRRSGGMLRGRGLLCGSRRSGMMLRG
ncbi:hypothetical protein M8818_003416 [Zalaria obscura]|uniref:Uncharacterized protein n=1 Tax=Zalaria obscura TaxID=2024903 RepID=A0ACC3SF20_9PEZI